MNDLIAKLEAADVGSRELSDEVLLALGWKKDTRRSRTFTGAWWRSSGEIISPEKRPSPTENLQDAVDLVPSGSHWSLNNIDKDWFLAVLESPGKIGLKETTGAACQPTLSLVCAILRAREADDT